ncbi:MAG: DUF4178 domain-containing protein [Steroidobacteraceae bacterium]|jgi:hypothetical protein
MANDPTGPKPKAITCPACGGSITLRALGASVMVACPYCRTQIDISKPEIQIIKRFNATAERFDLPLGARGPLRGKTYQIIGAMIRSDQGFRWTEYLLFNPFIGFRWLVEDQGHWSFAEPIKDVSAVRAGPVGMRYQDREFRKFAVANAVVETVVGEFYWRVQVGDQAATRDYVAPPWMLSQEETSTESIWTLMQYLNPTEVEAAFKVTLTEPDGIAPHQPCPATQTLGFIKRYVWGALALALVLQAATLFSARSQTILLGTYEPAAARGQEAVFGPVHLDARRSLNEITASAPLNNSWVDLDYALVNRETGESYEFGNGFEFYSGADSDGAWTEGSTSGSALVPALPRGDYNVVVDSLSGDSTGGAVQQPIRLTLTHDVAPWRNFWLSCAAILLYPLILVYRRLVFERRRWSDSAFDTHIVRKH